MPTIPTTLASSAPLDKDRWQTMMSDMKATARDFTRRFSVFHKAARAGQKIEVIDREGVVYAFQRQDAEPPSLADTIADLVGSVNTGIRRKSLEGYGRNKRHR